MASSLRRGPSPPKWRPVAKCAVAVLAAAVAIAPLACGADPAVSRPTLVVAPASAPAVTLPQIQGKLWNVVVVMTDDQSLRQTAEMPKLRRWAIRQGVTYPHAFIQSSTCCPSRASFLTGLFVARHGVQDNDLVGTPGGYATFVRNGNENRSLALQLRRAGYVTGLFGKYFNEYGTLSPGVKPRGWDRWRALTTLESGHGYQGFGATVPIGGNENRLQVRRFRHGYSTRWLGSQTVRFIQQAPKAG